MNNATPHPESRKTPRLVAMERHPWQPGLLIGLDLEVVFADWMRDEPWTIDYAQYGVGREWDTIVRQLVTAAFSGRTICLVGSCDDPPPPFEGMLFHMALREPAAVWVKEKCPERLLREIADSMELELGWMTVTTTVPLGDRNRFERVLMSHLNITKRDRMACEDEAFEMIADGYVLHWRNPSLPLDDIYAICNSAAKDVGLAFVVK